MDRTLGDMLEDIAKNGDCKYRVLHSCFQCPIKPECTALIYSMVPNLFNRREQAAKKKLAELHMETALR